jgi:UDP-N-acetylglucosamine 3-dehydrogenase
LKKVRIGIVGLGTIAKAHIPVLVSLKDIEIIAVTEIDGNRSEKFAKKWNINQTYQDYNKMYREADIDGVFIFLPSFLHFDAAKSALENDISVFCEKPMGLNGDAAAILVNIASKRNLVLSVGYNRRLEENFAKAREIVESLRLGNILQAQATLLTAGPHIGWIPSSEWFFNDKFGVLYDVGSHMVDLILYVLADRIVEVSAIATGTMHSLDIYDNVVCTFKTEKGTIGSFNVGWKIAPDSCDIKLYGTAGSLLASPNEIELLHARYGYLDRVPYHLRCARQCIRNRAGNETYRKEDQGFLDAIRGNHSSSVMGEEGLRVLEVLDAIKESLKKKEKIVVYSHN